MKSKMLGLLLVISLPGFAQSKKINVSVSKTLELISTVCNQVSTEFLKDSIADPYLYRTTLVMRQNYEHFKQYQTHPVIPATQNMFGRIGTGVYLLGLFYDIDNEFQQPIPLSKEILDAIHPSTDSAYSILNGYMNQLFDFYRKSDFESYYKSKSALYELALNEATKNLPDENFLPAMEAYYGETKQNFAIIIMPSFKSGWGMAWEVDINGKRTSFNISAPFQEQKLDRNGNVLECGFNNATEMRNLAVHEFGHTFINPLTALPEFADQIAKYNNLFKPVQGQAQYSDWATVFNETLVRTGEIRIALKLGDEKESLRLADLYRNWVYIPHFLKQFETYERNRKKYPTFKSFLPEAISSLTQLR